MAKTPDHYDVIVIGAGPAGTAAALRAAELGARVAVVEAVRTGGTCVNTGCVPTRVLAKTARLAREVRIAHQYGLAVSDPVVDWASTVARVRSTVDRVRDLKAEPERFELAGIDLILEGRAHFVDATTIELDSGRRLTGDSIIVAVGGHSRPLPIPGAELATVPEHVLDLPALPARVAIIGAGNTGAQLVTVLSAFGSQVTLLDVAPRILAVADEQISDAVGTAFAEQGVRVLAGIETVESLARAEDGKIALTWRQAGTTTAEPFDAVIMATGWPADVGGLGPRSGGRPDGAVRDPGRSVLPQLDPAHLRGRRCERARHARAGGPLRGGGRRRERRARREPPHPSSPPAVRRIHRSRLRGRRADRGGGAGARPELHRRRRAVRGSGSCGDRRSHTRLPEAHRRSPPRS